MNSLNPYYRPEEDRGATDFSKITGHKQIYALREPDWRADRRTGAKVTLTASWWAKCARTEPL